MSGRKRSLMFVVGTLLAVVAAFFISGTLNGPESAQPAANFSNGEYVELAGELVCLQHRDQSGPQTMECAFGFRDESGTYFGLQDTTPDYSLLSGVPMGQPITIGGIYRPSEETEYLQSGTIELQNVIE